MSASTSRPPDSPRRVRAAPHRPGLAKAWNCMKAAMKRKKTAATTADADGQVHAPFGTAVVPDHMRPHASTAATTLSAPSPPLSQCVQSTVSSPNPRVLSPAAGTPAIMSASSDIDSDDDAMEEKLFSLLWPTSGISHEKTQEMFAKHGVKYQPRFTRTTDEPPAKIRRVHMPVKVRVRWTCEQCNSVFGASRTCISCGHTRCDTCTRSPSKRPKVPCDKAGETASQEPRHSKLDEPIAVNAGKGNPPDSYKSTASEECSLLIASLDESLSEPLEKDNLEPSLDDDAEPEFSDELLLQSLRISCRGPRFGPDVVLKPKTQIIRRLCHECNTQILPPNRVDCQSCGHLRCADCPRYPAKPQKWPYGSPGDQRPTQQKQLPSASAVPRIFREARQRVRYHCEHCSTTFVENDNCQECGHRRCRDCIRVPPRHPVPASMDVDPIELDLD